MRRAYFGTWDSGEVCFGEDPMRAIFWLRFAGVIVALLVAALVSLPSSPNSAPLWLTTNSVITVDRTLKGDRLPVATPTANKPRQVGLPAAAKPSQPKEKRSSWCEGAFGPTASPRLQGIFQRCTV
jgi:hypothetical protein